MMTQAEAAQLLNAMLLKLSRRERQILKLRFGLGEEYTYSQAEVGKLFSVSPSRARELEKNAREKMNKLLASDEFRGLAEYLGKVQ